MSEAKQVSSIESQNVITTPANLLQIAVEKGAELEKLEKLMDLQARWDADQARKQFAEALAGFQAELGPIVKSKKGHNCKYADIDDIAQKIRPIMEKYSLSYSFDQEQDSTGIFVTCTIRHKSGHSQSNRMGAPFDTSGGKNNIQAIASSVTYLRRYTLTGALGITTGEDDNDGGKPSTTVDDLIRYLDVVRDELQSLAALQQALAFNDFAAAKESWGEIDQDQQRILWRAPTKGSVLSTDERNKMKSEDWSQA